MRRELRRDAYRRVALVHEHYHLVTAVHQPA
jgi:hypothetical protein